MPCFSEEEIARFPSEMCVLEMGCGQRRHWEHSVTIDINPRSVADVLHDLNVLPYPFPENKFDLIIAEHVLEHLGNLIPIVEELHRILKPGGLLCVEVPHFSNSDFFTDPTHTHAFSSRSFDYFVPGTVLNEFRYSTVAFKKRKALLNYKGGNPWREWFGRWINANQERYERKLAFILPRVHINFELEAIKDNVPGIPPVLLP